MFAADYHVILTKSVSDVSAVTNGGRWVEFCHFETHMEFSVGGKCPAAQLKLVFLHVFF